MDLLFGKTAGVMSMTSADVEVTCSSFTQKWQFANTAVVGEIFPPFLPSWKSLVHMLPPTTNQKKG